MNKTKLIAHIALQADISKAAAARAVDAMIAGVSQSLKKGEPVALVGFGTFVVSSRAAREGRNPRTGETVHVKAKRLPFFKVGKELRENINASTAPLEGADDSDPDEADDGPEDDDEDVPATD